MDQHQAPQGGRDREAADRALREHPAPQGVRDREAADRALRERDAAERLSAKAFEELSIAQKQLQEIMMERDEARAALDGVRGSGGGEFTR